MIRSSKHSLKDSNIGKHLVLDTFLTECRSALAFYVDYIWNHMDCLTYQVPKYMSTADIVPPNTMLSARALKCIAGQALGIVKAETAIQRRRIYKRAQLVINGESTTNLDEKIISAKITKPKVNPNTPIELNSIIIKYSDSEATTFDGFVDMHSMGKSFQAIQLPIKKHRHSNRLAGCGKLKAGILITNDYVWLRWEIPKPKPRKNGIVIGADQGMRTLVTLSDGQVTGTNEHGHDLNSITRILSRKRKGSNAFHRTQRHRTNYINWSINQLNIDSVGEFRLEKLRQVRHKRRTNRYLSHFTYTDIRKKISDICEVNGVRFTEQDNRYRSQRCNECGYVHQANRHAKGFVCQVCGHETDADLNAARNNAVSLWDIPRSFGVYKLNRTEGFYWMPDGVYDLYGQELTVPDDAKM